MGLPGLKPHCLHCIIGGGNGGATRFRRLPLPLSLLGLLRDNVKVRFLARRLGNTGGGGPWGIVGAAVRGWDVDVSRQAVE